MLNLKKITLVAMASKNIYATINALLYSSKYINFHRVLLISHMKPFLLPKKIDFEYTEKTIDIYDWCRKIIYDLNSYIDSEFIILIHSDGFIVNPDSWRNDFLNYDYIGAPWPIPTDNSFRDKYGNIIRVGNSVSLRSKKLLELPSKLSIPWVTSNENFHEDGFICCDNRHTFIENGINFAPLEIAKFFSHESMIPEISGIKPFAFHKWFGSNSVYPGKIINKLKI